MSSSEANFYKRLANRTLVPVEKDLSMEFGSRINAQAPWFIFSNAKITIAGETDGPISVWPENEAMWLTRDLQMALRRGKKLLMVAPYKKEQVIINYGTKVIDTVVSVEKEVSCLWVLETSAHYVWAKTLLCNPT